MVLAGVGHGRVLVWEVIDGRNWNGDVAAEMYTGPIKAALKRAAPRKRKWRILEDNDPSGFKCKKGLAAKTAANIESFDIPRRSPAPTCATAQSGPKSAGACARQRPSGRQVGPSPAGNI